MWRAGIVVVLGGMWGTIAAAEPRVLNAAGLAPAGLPGSAVARGALMTILGEELGPGRVSLSVTDAQARVHTFAPLFAAGGQVNALLPCAVTPGEARLLVTVNGRPGPVSEPFQVASENFQLFTRNQRGFGPAVAENLGGGEPRLNSLVSPAAPGQALALWGTGLGLCEGPPDRLPATVWIGGRVAPVVARQPATEIPGVERMIVLIPWDAPPGCFVPVVVRSGREFSNFASLSIGTSPAGCSDKQNGFTLLTRQLQERPVTWARLQLMHGAATTERPGIVVLQTSAEQGEAGFLRSTLETLGDFAHYPPAGSCLVRPLGSTGRAGTALDAGSLLLRGPWDLALAPDREDGLYRRRLAPTPFENRSGDFIRPQSRYVVVGQGGRQVGRFEAVLNVPRFLRWTNREELPFALARWSPVVLRWSGGEAGRESVVIRGFSFDRRINRGREFVCLAAVEEKSFRLPEALLWSLPATPQDFFISVGNAPLLAGASFQAPGLDLGFFSYETATGRNFALQ